MVCCEHDQKLVCKLRALRALSLQIDSLLLRKNRHLSGWRYTFCIQTRNKSRNSTAWRAELQYVRRPRHFDFGNLPCHFCVANEVPIASSSKVTRAMSIQPLMLPTTLERPVRCSSAVHNSWCSSFSNCYGRQLSSLFNLMLTNIWRILFVGMLNDW